MYEYYTKKLHKILEYCGYGHMKQDVENEIGFQVYIERGMVEYYARKLYI